MDSRPPISVCIPSYNNQDFIAATLESILRQTYGNFEIVITDDHSTDGTVSVIKSFADPRINLVENPSNPGIGANWNKALSLAGGKYVKLLCGDDLLHPDCLRQQMEILENPSHSGVVLAICSSNVINAHNEIVLRRRSRFGAGRVSGRKVITKCVRWGTNLIGEPAVGMFKRDILARTGMFDPINPYLIDLAFWAELLRHGDAFVDQSRLASFRLSTGSVSTKVGLRQARCFRSFVRKIHNDPFYQASTLDSVLGTLLSLNWCVLRNLFITFRAGNKGIKK